MSEVVGIRSDVTPAAGKPQPAVIRDARRLLEMAESGELQGLAYVGLHRDSTSTYHLSGIFGPYGPVGACALLLDDLKDMARE